MFKFQHFFISQRALGVEKYFFYNNKIFTQVFPQIFMQIHLKIKRFFTQTQPF